MNDYLYFLRYWEISSVIRQKGESQNECFKKTKHAKFSEKRTFLTPWYAHVRKTVNHLTLMMMMIWWWIVFCRMVDWRKSLASLPAETIVTDPHHLKSPNATGRIWTCAEPEFRLSWMKLCGSDNHYITASFHRRCLTGFSIRQCDTSHRNIIVDKLV